MISLIITLLVADLLVLVEGFQRLPSKDKKVVDLYDTPNQKPSLYG